MQHITLFVPYHPDNSLHKYIRCQLHFSYYDNCSWKPMMSCGVSCSYQYITLTSWVCTCVYICTSCMAAIFYLTKMAVESYTGYQALRKHQKHDYYINILADFKCVERCNAKFTKLSNKNPHQCFPLLRMDMISFSDQLSQLG